MNENIDKEFAILSEQLGHLEVGRIAGTNEKLLREQMGDAEYEKMVAIYDQNNITTIQGNMARVNYVNAMARLHLSVAGFVSFSTLMGIAWSIWFWVH